MEARTVNDLLPAASHDDAVGCLVAIELSKKSWIVAVNTPLSDKISRHTLKPGDGKELLDLCERIRTRVARETKRRVEIVSCYEAGYDGFWLHRGLTPAHFQSGAMCRDQGISKAGNGKARTVMIELAWLRGPGTFRCGSHFALVNRGSRR